MNRLERYWNEVRAKEAEFTQQFPEGVLFVTPNHDPSRNFFAGDAVQVDPMIAAKGVIEGRFRLSTASEVQTYHSRGQERQAITDAQNLRTNGMVKVLLSPARGPK
jgi:hypothetical protein